MITVVLLVGALTLTSCTTPKLKQGDAMAPPPPTLAPAPVAVAPAPAPLPRTTISPAPAPIPRATVSPVPAPVPTDVVARGQVYVLKEGDTFSNIAREQFGGLHRLRDLINANPGIDPNKIHPGQKINLPEVN
jgi:nucleoid-associated protein YgaU